jgi:hypothetical protein
VRISQKPTNVLNRGLITEAGELTFPEGASVDELNCSLERTGSRRRRLGINFEAGYQNQTFTSWSEGVISSVNTWSNPGGVAGKTFTLVQIGNILSFYDVQQNDALSQGYQSGKDINLNTYNRPTGNGSANAPIEVANIFGYLIVASAEINTILLTYDEVTDTISAEELTFRYRDFEWLGDREAHEEGIPLTSVTEIDKYNTFNTGWRGLKGDAALSTYISSRSEYPPLTHAWYAGKNSSGNFSVAEWEKVYSGSSLIANGSYVLDLYSGDRRTVSGLPTIPNATEETRFSTVVSFAGRVFYAGLSSTANTSKVFFSRVCDSIDNVGEFLQQNDPTAEDFSDLLDSDGGVIHIPEAYNIRKLHVLGPNVIVFAENGIWQIRGVEDVFSATAYAINKISEVGLYSPASFVSAEGRPYWWSDSGIYTLRVSQEGGALQAVNISLDTIQTFWEAIDPSARSQCKGVYDGFNNRVFWIYPDEGFSIDYKMNRVLILDEVLQAFYPWQFVDDPSKSCYVIDAVYLKGSGASNVESQVVDGLGNFVIDSGGDSVVVTRSSSFFSSSSLKFLSVTPSGKLTFSEVADVSFLDWGASDYSSYFVAGYNFLGDLTTKKNIIYTTVYMRLTETGLTGNALDGYVWERPSSCLLSTFWDFRDLASTTPQQVYRMKNIPVVDGSETYPNSVLTSRLRVRGRGRQVLLRFESETGKDFYLLGFDMISNSKGSF